MIGSRKDRTVILDRLKNMRCAENERVTLIEKNIDH